MGETLGGKLLYINLEGDQGQDFYSDGHICNFTLWNAEDAFNSIRLVAAFVLQIKDLHVFSISSLIPLLASIHEYKTLHVSVCLSISVL